MLHKVLIRQYLYCDLEVILIKPDYFKGLRPDEIAYLYFLEYKEQLRNHWIGEYDKSDEEVFN
jgi:hypothetical protein